MLDLGKVPAADYFPLAADPACARKRRLIRWRWTCATPAAWRAQLADDDTVADEPRGVEPQALKDQAEAAIKQVAADGWLRGDTVIEFGSPHGGTWTLRSPSADSPQPPRGRTRCWTASASCTNQTSAAPSCGAHRSLNPGGVLLLQYHSIVTIVRTGSVECVRRHGHFAYYSLTTLTRLLGAVGLRVVTAWEFDLYGGTVLLAAVHGEAEPDESVLRILETENALNMTKPCCCRRPRRMQPIGTPRRLRGWLEAEAGAGHTVVAYGACVAGGGAVHPRRDRFPVACRGRRCIARQAGQADAGHRHPDRVAG